ncbi:MAG: exodeoxyribonuclease I, partial [Candidatus Saccharimonadales bacterium]
MAKTFFFYDLETSGLNPRLDRIMQFAGIRTDMDFNVIGEPYNVLIKLNDDTLPSPEAVMVTHITPQETQMDGLTEAAFVHLLSEEIFTPETITLGFNNIRFDDEFIRHLLWRNFHDPYKWAYDEGRSRWDMLDVVRMTRALRPEGITWPVVDGKPTNRLELLTIENGLEHLKAHDALSDVEALISVAKLIKGKQPQLFDYLFKLRDKKEVMKLVNLDEKKPFVYVSGHYDNEFNKATVAFPLTSGRNSNVVVYDLRYDPSPFVALDQGALEKIFFTKWKERQAEGFHKLPIKELQYNRTPAVAPLVVLEQSEGWKTISLDMATIEKHKKILLMHPDFAERVRGLYEDRPEFSKQTDPEAQLYDSFLNPRDSLRVKAVSNADAQKLVDFHPEFQDERLSGLLLHYKARSFPKSLSQDETIEWEEWRAEHLNAQLPGFLSALRRLMKKAGDEEQFILQ